MSEFPPNTVFYAIGDVHGVADRLVKLHLAILRHHRDNHDGQQAVIVHLGDYVDRGPESREVIETIMGMERRAVENPDLTIISLRGNHEEMMLEGLTGSAANLDNWLRNGGTSTLNSYRPGRDIDETMLRFPKIHHDWLSRLPTIFVSQSHKLIFVHAGIDPREYPDGNPQRHLWTRSSRFFDTTTWTDNPALEGMTVVHGHTPVDDVEVKQSNGHRRINVDTGAVFGGPLTAVVLTNGQDPDFIQIAP